MYPNYTHLLVLHILLSPLQCPPMKIKKIKPNEIKQADNKQKNPSLLFLFSSPTPFHSPWWHLEWCVTQCTPFSIQLYQQKFIAMNHQSGSRPLVSGTPLSLDPHQNSSGLSNGCPESLRSCGYCYAWPLLSQAPVGPRWDPHFLLEPCRFYSDVTAQNRLHGRAQGWKGRQLYSWHEYR